MELLPLNTCLMVLHCGETAQTQLKILVRLLKDIKKQ